MVRGKPPTRKIYSPTSTLIEKQAMAGNAENGGGRCGCFWRIAPWVIAALILLLPLGAMQFTDEVVWDEADFAVMAACCSAPAKWQQG